MLGVHFVLINPFRADLTTNNLSKLVTLGEVIIGVYVVYLMTINDSPRLEEMTCLSIINIRARKG